MALPVRHSGTPTALRARGPWSTAEQWEPFHELDDLHSRMEQLMQGVLADGRAADGAVWVPPVDIEETNDAWIVEAELPGVDKKDVNIEMRDSELRVSGEIKERERTGMLRRRARRVGEFEYRVTLPGHTDPNAIDASLDGGVLTVRIPKPQEQQPHRIDVQ